MSNGNGNNVNSGSAIYSFKPTSLLLNGNNRLTIAEEEDDDNESIIGAGVKY